MGDVFLTDAADWLRAAGLVVVEYEGWRTRCKSSGGYNPGRPWGVMWHHTASNGDAEDDAYYQCYVADAAPISNATIDRNGDVWLLAAGPTNTNGSGRAHRWSKGTVPDDSMNSYAWGIELCNNGGGGTYPQAQIDAAFLVSNTINLHVGNQPTDVCTHQVWAPDRKVDPAQASAVDGPWQPRSCTSSGSWHLEDVQTECISRGWGPGPEPEPPEDDMPLTLVQCRDADAAFFGPVQTADPLICGALEWTGAGDTFRAPAIVNGLQSRIEVDAADLQNVTLLGDIPPPGADRHRTWTERDFYAVIPRQR